LKLLRCIAVLHADWYWTAARCQGDLTWGAHAQMYHLDAKQYLIYSDGRTPAFLLQVKTHMRNSKCAAATAR